MSNKGRGGRGEREKVSRQEWVSDVLPSKNNWGKKVKVTEKGHLNKIGCWGGNKSRKKTKYDQLGSPAAMLEGLGGCVREGEISNTRKNYYLRSMKVIEEY